jgi:prepilin-type N-terminal cleavage/methylation domain-containing protein
MAAPSAREKTTMRRQCAAFSLVELMIAVAIIGILAAVALPRFQNFQMRSRTGEARTNLAALRTAEEGYAAEQATYLSAPLWPRPLLALDGDKANWTLPVAGYDTIGWQPEGEVFASYQVFAGPLGCPSPALPCTHYTEEAASDLDADGNFAWWGLVKADAGGLALPGIACPSTGVYDAVSGLQDLRATVGPCAAAMGQTIF